MRLRDMILVRSRLAVAAVVRRRAARRRRRSRLAKKHNCMACHQVDKKVGRPRRTRTVAKKYKGEADAAEAFADKVKKGGGGVWGPVPMPPQRGVPDADIKAMVDWILAGAK